MLLPGYIANTPYNNVFFHGATQIAIQTLDDLFNFTYNLLKRTPEKKLIFGYWPKLDECGHLEGVNHSKTIEHFHEIDNEFTIFLEKMEELQSNTTIMVIADHGLVDITSENTIWLHDHVTLEETLTLPLCGEPRAPFCYVRPSQVNKFESYIHSQFDEKCILMKYEQLLQQNVFGLFSPHPRFLERVGDYVLLMKENYILRDRLLGEQRHILIGNHGGMSNHEMYVPFIKI